MAGTPGDPSALITAELRIHQAPTHDVEDPTSLYTVAVHRVINVDSMGYELKFHITVNDDSVQMSFFFIKMFVVTNMVVLLIVFRNLKIEQVTAVNTSAGSEGWLEFNVTSPLATWLAAPADNHGFFVTLHPHSQPGSFIIIR